MKKVYRVLTILVSCLVVILMAFSVLSYLRSDKEPPKIVYEGDTVKYDGINQQLLLSDVTALDETDGDVSNTLRIKTVLESDDEIIVTYLAKDKSNNISVSSRYIAKSE